MEKILLNLPKDFFKKLRQFWEPIIKAYSGIFFLPNLRVGTIVLLLTFLDFNIGLSGLLAILSAYLFARFLGVSKDFIKLDYYIYNPLLVGLGIGFLFKLSLISLVLIVILSSLTFLLTFALSNIFWYYLRLPILSIPFVIVGIVTYLASYKYSKLFVYYLYPHYELSSILQDLPLIVKGFLSSLGAIVFYPYPIVGLLIFLFLLRFSPILSFLSVVGYLVGTTFLYLLGLTPTQVYSDISAFNYILVATTVGGVFLVPHTRSYLIASLGVLISVPVVEAAKVFFQYYGIPIFALPFNAVALLILYTLFLLGYKYLSHLYLGTPERTLENYLRSTKRFPYFGREIGLPFSGRWTVWQSFDGEWTHRGPWKYALDFVITDEEGKTYRDSGYYLTDYYAYRKPVLSPVSGIVVEVVDGYPDNPPGSADKENNWGNYVLIYDWRGFYVLLCHFAQNSIKVKKGDKVERGTILGLCGNSGYSPQPHIHMHVQLLPKVGAATVPFVIENYITDQGEFKDYSVPQKGEVIEAFYPDKVLKEKFNLLIEDRFKFLLEGNGETREQELVVKMAEDGTFYLTDGKGKLYFGQRFGVFYTYRVEGNSKVLKLLSMALSKLPLNLNRKLLWKDYLPIGGSKNEFIENLYRFIASFYHKLLAVEGIFRNEDGFSYRLKAKLFNRSIESYVKISNKRKFVEEVNLKIDKERYTLKRID